MRVNCTVIGAVDGGRTMPDEVDAEEPEVPAAETDIEAAGGLATAIVGLLVPDIVTS